MEHRQDRIPFDSENLSARKLRNDPAKHGHQRPTPVSGHADAGQIFLEAVIVLLLTVGIVVLGQHFFTKSHANIVKARSLQGSPHARR